MPDPNCQLCKAEHLTEWLYEDQTCWVAVCSTCNPDVIVVYRNHGTYVPEAPLAHMLSVARRLFGDKLLLDFTMRSIPEHFHFHVRHFNRDQIERCIREIGLPINIQEFKFRL